jgi:hypothetical protein
MISPTLERNPRTLREALDTQAEIEREVAALGRLYREIEQRCEIITKLEERAAILGDEIRRRAWPFSSHRTMAEVIAAEDQRSL